LIVDEKNEFDQVVLLGNNFTIKYEQLLNAHNEGQCDMVSIKNLTTTSKDINI
jgi:hypothetical protein